SRSARRRGRGRGRGPAGRRSLPGSEMLAEQCLCGLNPDSAPFGAGRSAPGRYALRRPAPGRCIRIGPMLATLRVGALLGLALALLEALLAGAGWLVQPDLALLAWLGPPMIVGA